MKFLFPLTAFAGSLTLQCFCAYAEASLCDLIFVLWLVLYLPAVSFFYARRMRLGGKRSVPYTLMHSLLHALAFVPFYPSKDGAAAALAILAWCELWALIGLIRKQKMPCFRPRKAGLE